MEYYSETRISADEMAEWAERANEIIATDLDIRTEAVAGEPEARIWRSGDMTIPCGGTHVRSTGEIGRVRLRRKRQGNCLERLYITTVDGEPTAAG